MTWHRFFQLVFIAYVLLVSYLSMSKPSGITDISTWDKLAHAGAYAVFTLLCGLMTRQRRHFWLAMLFCCCFGLAIEYLQSLTPYRTGSWADMVANLTGLAVGYILLRAGRRWLSLADHRDQPKQ